ncbi:MAG: ATP-binding protein [bacterium]|nr:ATP-binding protein [bacterium]
MQIDELYLLNPWWKERSAINSDSNILKYQNSSFRYFPEKIFREINPDKPGIYTIRGPRQVGKTTFLKLYIKELLENGVNPTSIFYLTCDGVRDRFELNEVLKLYFETFGKNLHSKKYVFIDEITLIREWPLTIKFMADAGVLDDTIVVLSGSSAYDLKQSSEKLPGRNGFGKDLVYMPITFREYLKNVGEETDQIPLMNIFSLTESDLKALEFKNGKIKEYFYRYLNSGGFPLAIDEFTRENSLKTSVSIYKDFVLSDAEKYIGSRIKVLEILRKLPDIVGQRFSWNSLVKVFSGRIESLETIEKYMEYLAYSFIIFNLFFVDYSSKTIRPKKHKKVYPIDKIIADVVAEIGGKNIGIPQIIEMITLRHILRDEDITLYGLNLFKGPYFWYSERGNEIDFVCEREGKLIPIEVKYLNNVSKSDYIGMKRVYGRGVNVTKDIAFKDGDIVGIPVWLFSGIVV